VLTSLRQYGQFWTGRNWNLPAETTGKWIAAEFEHDSARPVDGCAAPQLQTHVVFFNLTETEDDEAYAGLRGMGLDKKHNGAMTAPPPPLMPGAWRRQDWRLVF
jgi:hypothetical protein